MPAARKASPRKAAPRKAAAAKVSESAPTPEVEAPSLYPAGTELFVFTAKDGRKIEFPKYSTVPTPSREMWWRLYQLDTIFQGFEWMRYAGVPDVVQALAVTLPDDEYEALFDGWFSDSNLNSGE